MRGPTPIAALIIGDELLTGKRQDKHLPHVIETLARRGLVLDAVHYLGDDRPRLTALLRDSFARGDIVFSFGGIGATPDDHTRQAAAAALDVPLQRHPEAVASIEQQFGDAAYPHRVLMAEFPAGATKRTLCSRKPIAVPWKYIPSGAPMIAAVSIPCRMRPP